MASDSLFSQYTISSEMANGDHMETVSSTDYVNTTIGVSGSDSGATTGQ